MKKRLAMFGNGSDPTGQNAQNTQIEPPATSSLWGDMFGIGPLFKMISDPALGAHAHQMMQAIIEGASASSRIEAKLNALLKALGHDVAEIERQAAAAPLVIAPALFAAHGANGTRGRSAATGAPDDGSRDASPDASTDGGDPRNGGADDDAAGARPR
jgi:hypothetical protein